MKFTLSIICAAVSCSFFNLAAGEKKKDAEEFPPRPAIPYLSVEDELKSFILPEGYRMELVMDEKSVREPVVCVFDGNGRMYVAEFRSYMQDIDATKELEPIGAVTRHESTKHDGVFDKHTVYAEKMLLPRMILPLDDRVLINETDSNDVYIYQDTKGNGVADKKDLWFAGGKRGGNLEHQQSGLVWGMDNWMYQAVNSFRLRWTGTGKDPLKENTPGNGGQWGLHQDDFGKMWFSNGGGEKGFVSFQVPIIYGGIELPNQQPPDFLEVWPVVGLGDVQGGHSRHRVPDLTLNHMTACCGQEIVRVDRMPEDMRGDALICEPVGRLIRRAKVENHDGMTFIKNAYDKKEFLLSTDPNFRPINITNGPDGCLYIVDMYRGIIQEGNWTKPDAYLHKVIKQYSLDKNFGKGRIWRLVHKDFQPGPQPHMLDETPAQLVAHLEHPNGWWRDTAQKLLVVKGDKSVVPALVAMAKTSKNMLARMHAIWTLEGLDALDKDLVLEAMKDPLPQIRVTAIRAGESLMKKGDSALIDQVKAMNKDADANVVLQSVMTARLLKFPDATKITMATLTDTKFEGVKALINKMTQTAPAYDPKRFNKAELARLTHGETIFRELCFACHGPDGKGMSKDAAPATVKISGKATGTTVAPSLAGSATVFDRDSILRVLCSGLTGPVANKTYDAEMIPMITNDDEWIADVASFVRNGFGNHGTMVGWEDVARARIAAAERGKPWTSDELQKLMPKGLANQGKWKLSASHNQGEVKNALDGDIGTRWDSRTFQVPGMWFQIELPEATDVAGILLNSAPSPGDYPRGYKVETSNDGKTWDKPVAEGKGSSPITEIMFKPVKTKFLKITQTGSVAGLFWSIHELALYPPNTPKPAESGPDKRKRLLAVTVALGNRSASIPAAEKVLAEMADRTGAFAVDFIKQPAGRPQDKAAEEKWLEKIKSDFAQKMSLEALKKYDGVIFLNTSGELPIPDKQAFLDWIKSGKGFVGVHGAADTLHEFKPYAAMLGGEFEGQAWNETVTLRIKDRKHPASATFLTKFEITDEIFQFKNWKRDDSHMVVAVDPSNDDRPKKSAKPGEPEKSFFERGCREDKDYSAAWTREFGTGHVFYTTLGQAEETWKNEKFQQHLYGGIKWALGLVSEDGTPIK